MKTSKRILTIFTLILFATIGIACFGEPVVAFVCESPHAAVAGATYAISPLVTMFDRDITKNLFPDNAFYKNSKDDTAFIAGNKVVKPQVGAKPNAQIDRTVLPAPIGKRTDTAEDYDIHEFTTDPTLLQDTEALIVSYPKRASILEDHSAVLNEQVADYFGNIWLPSPAANIIRTSGAARAASSNGATGNRKAVTKNDFIDVFNKLNRMDIPQSDRFCCLPADFLADVLKIEEFVSAEKIGSANLIKGQIGELLGFKIFVRSRLGVYDNTATPVKRAFGAVPAATDNAAALFWHKMYVCRAEGSAKTFIDADKPEYYGTVFSALLRAGGRIARTDEKGVIALVETTTA